LKLQGKRNPVNALWVLLKGFAEKREGLWGETPARYPPNFKRVGEVINVLKVWYDTMTHQEKPVYLYHAVLLISRRRQIDWQSEPVTIETSPEEVTALYQRNLAGQTIAIDDYIIDMHTGVRTTEDRTRFAQEGAVVVKENQALLNTDYRKIYCELKRWLDRYEQEGLAFLLAQGVDA
jgi:hypothetical protein